MIDVVHIIEPHIELVSVAHPGLPGSGVDNSDVLHVSQRLAEFSTPEAKAAARANLELDVIDAGTFF